MKFKMMSVFYSLHRKDGALLDHFIHSGGLLGLAEFLGDEHRVIQSQVVELIMEMVSPLLQLPVATSGRQGHIYHQMFLCIFSPVFWRNVSQILLEPHEVFPKSHASCLRILAGAVGWLRPEEPQGAAPGGPAGPALDVSVATHAIQQFTESPAFKAAMPDVRGLAEDLLAELQQGVFCRADPLGRAELAAARSAVFAPEAVAREDAAHAWQSLKERGNEAFKAGLIWPAEAAYRLALQEAGSLVPAAEASLIESNRALVLLRAGHPADASSAAAEALARDPRNAKAAYRRATAFMELAAKGGNGATSAARSAHDAVAAAELAACLEPSDAKVAELLAQARKRADELGPPPAEEDAAAEEVLDGMD